MLKHSDQSPATPAAAPPSGGADMKFLATLAHELRNPLAPIANIVQVLQMKGAVRPELAWTLDAVERQVRQMTRLIEDLLDFSRISAGKLKLRRAPVDLAEVLRIAVETSQPHVGAGGHTLTIHAPGERVMLDGDVTRLAQVLSNLLINAAKYTPPGGRIELRAERREREAIITIRDNGIGIEPAQLGHIFEIFAQGDRPEGVAHDGLGIGLALARHLVQLHGGAIAAASEGLGKGSQFSVRLPALTPLARPAPVPSDSGPSGIAPGGAHGSVLR